MKKILSIILTAIIICTAFASCSGKSSYEDLAIIDLGLEREYFGIAFRSGSDMTRKVEDITLELINDGTLAELSTKYEVGAIGKGYATERLYERLKAMGADSVALNIGGNIRTLGLKPGGEGWETGITNPDKTSADFATIISLGRTACVTSGDYERYYVVDGTRYHHIIDPDTLMPAVYFSAVTVITEDSGLADALSTALFCVDYDRGIEMLGKIDARVDVIWITRDGRLIKTNGIVEIGG